ncbi:Elongin-A [Neolecta irregularis DAH-3]|uniref:Elongin-A n=1 Tax=Neolecta irregularis (strain DAH-3) TaxID=1198029 RepID=A0A1U7LKQ1_NEOID|nr:Elongin-A [Neolecta irregularis DAH-3]|eukprot:OLL23236.1 Elongin-A [Neolecta irregularis DAH-3]
MEEADFGDVRFPGFFSLKALAMRKLLKCKNEITDLGDCEFHLVKLILETLSAERLAILEKRSPHLKQETGDLWEKHVRNDFKIHIIKEETRFSRNQPSIFDDESPQWRLLYKKWHREQSTKLERASQKLREAQQSIDSRKAERSAKVLSKPLLQPKRSGWGAPSPRMSMIEKLKTNGNKPKLFRTPMSSSASVSVQSSKVFFREKHWLIEQRSATTAGFSSSLVKKRTTLPPLERPSKFIMSKKQ